MKDLKGALAATLAIPALSLAVAGCEVSIGGGDDTTTSTIDNSQLEESLRVQLSKDAGVDPTDVTVSCPDDQEAKEGAQFQCTLTAPNGRDYTVDVTLTNDSGGFDATIPKGQ